MAAASSTAEGRCSPPPPAGRDRMQSHATLSSAPPPPLGAIIGQRQCGDIHGAVRRPNELRGDTTEPRDGDTGWDEVGKD